KPDCELRCRDGGVNRDVRGTREIGVELGPDLELTTFVAQSPNSNAANSGRVHEVVLRSEWLRVLVLQLVPRASIDPTCIVGARAVHNGPLLLRRCIPMRRAGG